MYLKSDGTVWAAGRNNFGQLGSGTTINRLNPVQVIHSNGTPLIGVKGIFTGDYFAVYLMEDGTVWSAGKTTMDNLVMARYWTVRTKFKLKFPGGVVLNNVVKRIWGLIIRSLLKSDGTVWATGAIQDGQLGDGTTVNRYYPGQVFESGSPMKGVLSLCRV